MSGPEIFDIEQGSEAWFRLRAGLPTASEFSTILAKGRDSGPSLTRKKYLHTLAAEIVSGAPVIGYSNADMERGRMQEAEAREYYALMHDADPDRVGFIKNGNKGCSPDALLGRDGGLEIKTRASHLQVELLLANRIPPEHKAQLQGNIWVSERQWWDIIVYCPGLPKFVAREYRDEKYIQVLAAAVARFNDELAEIVEKIRRLGVPQPSLTEQLKASLALEEANGR